MRRIHIATFGCQMNKLDSECCAALLQAAGHEIAPSVEEADAVLFYTCSVRQQAENRVLSAIGSLRPRKVREKHFLIGVLGCMAQRRGESLLREYPQIDLVCGTRAFHRLPELIAQAETGQVLATETEEGFDLPPELRHGGGLQAYVAVMRGCDNRCAYCVVPDARGHEESIAPEKIVAEARLLLEKGAREITLLGQSVDKYGYGLTPIVPLAELLRQVHELPGLVRLRFLTAHPKGVTEELFRAMAALPKVCEHMHAPAQSGSNRILEVMRRRYTREHYDNLLDMGRRILPGIVYTSDFIVGFPGETEADFLQTLDLVEKQKFGNIYAFRYSPRPNTPSSKMEDDVPDEEKERRLQALLGAQQKNSLSRNEALVGTVQRVMVEGVSKRDSSRLMGRTRGNFIAAFALPKGESAQPATAGGQSATGGQDDEAASISPISGSAAKLAGQEVSVRIKSCTALTLLGELIP